MALSISDAARLTGLSIHTLRYYDERGLMPRVKRAENGHRIFDTNDLDWIGILKCLRSTEMPLADMQRFTQLVQDGPESSSERRAMLEAHRRVVEARMHEIDTALVRIDEKIAYYREMESHKTDTKQTAEETGSSL